MTTAMKLRKILFVTADILPKRGGSAIVMENLFSVLPPDRVAVMGESKPFTRPNRPTNSPSVSYFPSHFSLRGRGARFFTSLRWRLLKPLKEAICKTYLRENCKVILGTYPDDLYCYAAFLAAKELDVPFISYFHNTYKDNAAIRNTRAARIQDEIFCGSKIVFVISDGMKDYFVENYGLRNCETLPHMFRNIPKRDEGNFLNHSKQHANIVLFGNFNESNIDATRNLIETFGRLSAFHINLYSDVPLALLRHRGLNSNLFTHRGSLSHLDFNDLVSELRKYDIVALTHGFSGAYGRIEYETIFPTRTIPMLLSDRPLLIHSPPDCFLTRFARDKQIGEIVDTKSSIALQDAAGRLLSDSDHRQRLIQNARTVSELFFAPNVISTFTNNVEATLGDS